MKRLVLILSSMFVMGAVTFVIAQDAKVDAGRKLFAEKKCATCHQAEGKGNKMYPLAGVAAKMSEADIRHWLTAPAEMEAKLKPAPKLKMSSQKLNLQPADVDALVAYIKSLK